MYLQILWEMSNASNNQDVYSSLALEAVLLRLTGLYIPHSIHCHTLSITCKSGHECTIVQ